MLREVAEMRAEMNARLDRLETQFDKLEADVKEIRRGIKLLRGFTPFAFGS